MVLKQSVRSRSKSASRKSKSPTNRETVIKPIVAKGRKSLKDDEDKAEKDVETSYIVTRRSTRQSTRATEFTSLDDWKFSEPFVYLQDNVPEETKKIADKIKSKNELPDNEIMTSKNTWSKTIVKILFSFIFVLIFPVLVIILNKMCENGGTLRLINFKEIKLDYFINCNVISLVFLWILFLSLLSVLPIGSSRSVSLSDGFQLRYRCNGLLSLIISMAGLLWLLHSKNLTTKLIYDNYYVIIGSSITLSLIISLVVYLKSFSKKSKLVINSGNIPYCFVMGREIIPRIFGLDLKYFYEFRPGLISWALLNVIFCVKDFEDNEYGFINPSLLLCAACQFIYCFDSLLFEGDVILKSFMVNERFGFIHCFGSQVIVPFIFTMTSRVIQINHLQISYPCLASVAILNFIGFVIYRSSNSQKNDFRRNPYSTHLSHLKTITTEHGQQLLAGGWWGLLRHPNYTGDIIMSICWSLCSGSCLMTCWLYPLYFTVFIVNRCINDERHCAKKHGKAWYDYKKLVRYRILPPIF